jgi:hypothetical protein
MSDAFDRWVQWRRKPPGDRRSIPAHLYAAVMSLPEFDRLDRHKVNEAVRRRNETRRQGRAVWLYLNDRENGKSRTLDDPDWIKVFASADAAGDPAWIKLFASQESAQEWVEINDPNRGIFEYPVQE